MRRDPSRIPCGSRHPIRSFRVERRGRRASARIGRACSRARGVTLVWANTRRWRRSRAKRSECRFSRTRRACSSCRGSWARSSGACASRRCRMTFCGSIRWTSVLGSSRCCALPVDGSAPVTPDEHKHRAESGRASVTAGNEDRFAGRGALHVSAAEAAFADRRLRAGVPRLRLATGRRRNRARTGRAYSR